MARKCLFLRRKSRWPASTHQVPSSMNTKFYFAFEMVGLTSTATQMLWFENFIQYFVFMRCTSIDTDTFACITSFDKTYSFGYKFWYIIDYNAKIKRLKVFHWLFVFYFVIIVFIGLCFCSYIILNDNYVKRAPSQLCLFVCLFFFLHFFLLQP